MEPIRSSASAAASFVNSPLAVTLSRRGILKTAACGGLSALGLSGWASALADELKQSPKSPRHCVLLWMTGGPAQTDTFDLKPGHANGGPFKEIETSVPGLKISEHLPKLATQAEHLAILRGMSTSEGDHDRGTYLMRTGRKLDTRIQFPTLGAVLTKEIETESAELPAYVSIGSNPRNSQPGYLGPRYAPLLVGRDRAMQPLAQLEQTASFADLAVSDLLPSAEVGAKDRQSRLELLSFLQTGFVGQHAVGASRTHDTTLKRTIQMSQGQATDAFDLSQEPPAVREAYGRGQFGQGCLLARRLIERGVSFVEVTLGDQGRWDTHNDNFTTVAQLSAELDAGWSSLLRELKERGLLESTTFLWMGEFGRTPAINGNSGRDHYPQAWTTVLGGAGIKGGQAHGRTDASGQTVEKGATDVGALLATLATALGVNPKKQNISEVGRPFKIAEGEPVPAVLA